MQDIEAGMKEQREGFRSFMGLALDEARAAARSSSARPGPAASRQARDCTAMLAFPYGTMEVVAAARQNKFDEEFRLCRAGGECEFCWNYSTKIAQI